MDLKATVLKKLGVFMKRPSASMFSEKIETTIGELVEVITQIAMETGKTEEEGYELAALTIERMLRRAHTSLAVIN